MPFKAGGSLKLSIVKSFRRKMLWLLFFVLSMLCMIQISKYEQHCSGLQASTTARPRLKTVHWLPTRACEVHCDRLRRGYMEMSLTKKGNHSSQKCAPHCLHVYLRQPFFKKKQQQKTTFVFRVTSNVSAHGQFCKM